MEWATEIELMQLSFLDSYSTLDGCDGIPALGKRLRTHLLEHVVVLDMIRQGYFAYHDSTKGRDAVLDTGRSLKRVQVKSAINIGNGHNPGFTILQTMRGHCLLKIALIKGCLDVALI
jgi:hypothetical protein